MAELHVQKLDLTTETICIMTSMEILGLLSSITGTITIAAFILFSFWKGLEGLCLLVFKPTKYIHKNHGPVLNRIIEKHFGEEIKKIVDSSITETLRDTGVTRSLDKQKSVLLLLTKGVLESQIKSQFPQYRERLLHIIKNNSRAAQAKVGINNPSKYNFYINLRNILPNSEDATTLSYILVAFIYEDIEKNNNKGYDFVAVNRNGNAILGYLISNFLNLPLVIVNFDSRWELDGKKVKVDGLSKIPRYENKKGFLVDDAVSGGSILKDSVEILRSQQLRVDDVYVLFSRNEDGAIKDYSEESINLHSIFDLNDDGIEKIINTDDNDLDKIIDEL